MALVKLGREEWKARPSAAWAGKDTACREANTGATEIRSEAAALVSWERPEKRLAIMVDGNFDLWQA